MACRIGVLIDGKAYEAARVGEQRPFAAPPFRPARLDGGR
jgi:hypothetical protein